MKLFTSNIIRPSRSIKNVTWIVTSQHLNGDQENPLCILYCKDKFERDSILYDMETVKIAYEDQSFEDEMANEIESLTGFLFGNLNQNVNQDNSLYQITNLFYLDTAEKITHGFHKSYFIVASAMLLKTLFAGKEQNATGRRHHYDLKKNWQIVFDLNQQEKDCDFYPEKENNSDDEALIEKNSRPKKRQKKESNPATPKNFAPISHNSKPISIENEIINRLESQAAEEKKQKTINRFITIRLSKFFNYLMMKQRLERIVDNCLTVENQKIYIVYHDQLKQETKNGLTHRHLHDLANTNNLTSEDCNEFGLFISQFRNISELRKKVESTLANQTDSLNHSSEFFPIKTNLSERKNRKQETPKSSLYTSEKLDPPFNWKKSFLANNGTTLTAEPKSNEANPFSQFATNTQTTEFTQQTVRKSTGYSQFSFLNDLATENISDEKKRKIAGAYSQYQKSKSEEQKTPRRGLT